MGHKNNWEDGAAFVIVDSLVFLDNGNKLLLHTLSHNAQW